MTEITQADRDAAAQYDVVEAFARHRMEATEALRVENERLREALDRIYMEDRRVVDRWRQSLATGDSHLDTQIVLGRFADIARAALGDAK